MAFINFAHGGDGTWNDNYSMYPQNIHVAGVNETAPSLLRPAEHMSPATYNIWRNIHFGEERNATNLGVREFINRINSEGKQLAVDDIIGLVAIPHEAILAGVYWRVEGAQAGTTFDIIRASDGTVIAAGVDASTTGVGFAATNHLVPADTNEIVAIKLVTWPVLDVTNADPCGVYGPCDDLSLCFTVNAFIWSPVAERFCKSDPCFGAKPLTGNVVPRDV